MGSHFPALPTSPWAPPSALRPAPGALAVGLHLPVRRRSNATASELRAVSTACHHPAGMRMVSPIMSSVMTDNTDSSNFDPDSDWEVDDTSVDFGLTEEPFVPSPPSKGPQRIW